MNLYIDIGNTAIKFGIDDVNEIKHILTISTEEVIGENYGLNYQNKIKSALKGLDFETVYYSSVVPEATKKLRSLFSLFDEEIIKVNDSYGININIDDKNELGIDLFCDLVAARKFYGSSTLIIDLGTATKFLYIDENDSFSSCAIVPGFELLLKSLHTNTALLPKIEIGGVLPLLDCHNTKDVLMSSNYYSHLDTINGIVKRYKKETGKEDLRVVITGGNVELFKDNLDFGYEIKHNLCLNGLKIIAEMEREK